MFLALLAGAALVAQARGGGSDGGLMFVMICYWIFILTFAVIMIVSQWVIFTKAGEPGWAAIVPFYNVYVLCRIAGKPGWWLILFLIPIVSLIISLLVCLGLAENFGKGPGFGIGLWLLGFIFFPMLAFGSAEYVAGKRRRRRLRVDDDYDRPAPRPRRRDDDDRYRRQRDEYEEDRPRRRRPEEDYDDRPRRKRVEDEDEDRPRRRRAAEDDEDRPRRRRPVDDDE
jgi:hypothetical protein